MKTPAQPSGGDGLRVKYLDGIRGWAAVVVLLFHVFWEVMGLKFPVLRAPLTNVVLNGPLAVFVFFVLSGDALATPYLLRRDLNIVREVSLRRYGRLTIPILLSCFICYVLMRLGLNKNVEAGKVLGVEYWLGGVANFDESFKGMLRYALYDVYFNNARETSYNPFLWTMSIEMLGSLMLFVFLFQHERFARPMWVCAGIALFFFWAKSYYALFFVGAWYAMLRADGVFQRLDAMPFRWLSWSLLLMVIGSCWRTDGMQADGIKTNSVRAAALLFALHCNTPLIRMLEGRLSQFMGQISLPLYLVHFSVIISFMSMGALWLNNRQCLSLGTALALGAATVAVALVLAHSFGLLERKLVKRHNQMLARWMRV